MKKKASTKKETKTKTTDQCTREPGCICDTCYLKQIIEKRQQYKRAGHNLKVNKQHTMIKSGNLQKIACLFVNYFCLSVLDDLLGIDNEAIPRSSKQTGYKPFNVHYDYDQDVIMNYLSNHPRYKHNKKRTVINCFCILQNTKLWGEITEMFKVLPFISIDKHECEHCSYVYLEWDPKSMDTECISVYLYELCMVDYDEMSIYMKNPLSAPKPTNELNQRMQDKTRFILIKKDDQNEQLIKSLSSSNADQLLPVIKQIYDESTEYIDNIVSIKQMLINDKIVKVMLTDEQHQLLYHYMDTLQVKYLDIQKTECIDEVQQLQLTQLTQLIDDEDIEPGA